MAFMKLLVERQVAEKEGTTVHKKFNFDNKQDPIEVSEENEIN